MTIEAHQTSGRAAKAGVSNGQGFGGTDTPLVYPDIPETVLPGSWLPYCVPTPPNRASSLGYSDGPYFWGSASCDLDGQAAPFAPGNPAAASFAAHHAAGGNSVGIWFLGGGVDHNQAYVWQSFHTTGTNDGNVPTYVPPSPVLAAGSGPQVPVPIVPPAFNPLVPPGTNQQPIGGTESGDFFQRKLREMPPGTKLS